MKVDVLALPNVDYSEKGTKISIIVGGRKKTQTVIYSGLDFAGEKWYYSEEGHKYILEARRRRLSQGFVKNYLDKIPLIVRNPVIVGEDTLQPDSYMYFGEITVVEHDFKRELFVVVMRKSNINVVWNFFWVEDAVVPKHFEIVRRTKRARRYLKRRRR